MQEKLRLLILLALSLPCYTMAQNTSLSGTITDNIKGTPIAGANILIKGTELGAVSNRQGHFCIHNAPQEKYTILVSFVGYEKISHTKVLKNKANFVNFKLLPQNTILKDIEISVHFEPETETLLKLAAKGKDIPITTSSVNAELIRQTQVNSINEALKYTTGIKPMVNYGGFQTFVMRGFGSPVIMLDGARDERMNFSNSAPLTSLAAVERIEYLKGPASVLYGHSAVGGILNVVRKQPSDTLVANFTATYGSWQTKRSRIGLGNKINDKLSYRFDVGFSDTKGWRNAANKTLNGYFALNYELNENNLFELRIAGNNDVYGTETGLPAVTKDIYSTNDRLVYHKGDLPTNFKRFQRYNDPSDFLDHENANVSLKYTTKLGQKSKLQIHTSYSDDLIDYFSTEDLSYLTSAESIYNNYYMDGNDKVYISLDSLQRIFPFRFSHETKTIQNCIDYSTQLKTGALKHKINAGYFYMYIDRTTFKGYNLGVDVTGAGLYSKITIEDPILNQGDLQTRFSSASIYNEIVNGIYVQNLIEASKKINFLIAARFDNYHLKNQSATIKEERSFAEKSKTKTIVNIAFTYRLGVVFKPIDNLSLYASYANFFKPRRSMYNKNHIYIDKDGKQFHPEDGGEIYEPEDGFQAECGFKLEVRNKLQLNGSAYYIEKENIVEYLGESSDDKRIYGQVGVVDSKGFDLEANYKPLSKLSILVGYGFNIARYRKFSDNDYTNSKEGNYIRNNPKNHVFVWAFYKYSNFNIGVGADYNDKVFTNSSNTYELPSHCLFDAVIGYDFSPAFIKLKFNNLFDEEYYSSSVYSNQYVPGPERNMMFTVGINL